MFTVNGVFLYKIMGTLIYVLNDGSYDVLLQHSWMLWLFGMKGYFTKMFFTCFCICQTKYIIFTNPMHFFTIIIGRKLLKVEG